MKTTTDYFTSDDPDQIAMHIDKLYEKYGNRLININLSSVHTTESYHYLFATILQDDEETTNNIY